MLCTDICYKIITKVIKVIKQCFTNTFNSIEFCMVCIKNSWELILLLIRNLVRFAFPGVIYIY